MERQSNPNKLQAFLDQRIRIKTEFFVADRGLTVEAADKPTVPCLIVANHPTIDDSMLWRTLGNVYHAVNSDSAKKTGIEPVDISITKMIPVYKGEKRKRTYDLISHFISSGNQIVLNPTGRTSGTNDVPKPEEVKLGAMWRSLQRLNERGRIVFPAFVKINGEIMPDGTVGSGSKVSIVFSKEPMDFSGINFDQDAPDSFAKEICDKWQELSGQ